jgi:AsmA family protein
LPQTAPFRLAGDIDYADKRVRFQHIDGRVGRSDVEGEIGVDPSSGRPQVTADLASRRVDLSDLGGFIGGAPGSAGTPGLTREQRAQLEKAKASSRLLPDAPINVPKLRFADVDLHYKGEHILGRYVPLDNLAAALTVRDGVVTLHPLSFGVGSGQIDGNMTLEPRQENTLHARADIDFRKVDVARLMAATHAFGGVGTIAGRAVIDGGGRSIGDILRNGNGDLKLFMTGGDLSALLVDLSGLEFGNLLLSALGLPQRTPVRCMVTDFELKNGIVTTRTLVLDTKEANVTGSGTVNLKDEAIHLQLKTEAKHFSIGSLPGPIDIGGHLKSPSIRPSAETVARGAAAAGLGALLTPLGALLPTIQLGLGEDNDCGALISEAKRTPNAANAQDRGKSK